MSCQVNKNNNNIVTIRKVSEWDSNCGLPYLLNPDPNIKCLNLKYWVPQQPTNYFTNSRKYGYNWAAFRSRSFLQLSNAGEQVLFWAAPSVWNSSDFIFKPKSATKSWYQSKYKTQLRLQPKKSKTPNPLSSICDKETLSSSTTTCNCGP